MRLVELCAKLKKMNRIVLLAFFVSPFHLLTAQDTIFKRDGEKLIVKLKEVNPGDVRYIRFDYQSGPLYTLLKQEIKYIVYSNGLKESFENYSPHLPSLSDAGVPNL